jgi:hypothetical protein
MSIDPDDVYLNLQDAVNRNECIYCSVSSYSVASRGCTDLTRGYLEEEQDRFARCEDKFVPLMDRLESFKNMVTDGCNTTYTARLANVNNVLLCIESMIDNVELLTPPFIENYDIGKLVRAIKETFEMSDARVKEHCKRLSKQMKRVYYEKKGMVPDGFVPVKGASKPASRGCTDLQVSQWDYTTCQNCSSKFCTSCIQELIQSIEGFKNIPTKLKQADNTYRQLMGIQTRVSLGIRSIISGPCCSFIAHEVSCTLVKTPRPDVTSRCSRIGSIKNYRASIRKIKPDKLQAPPLDNLNLREYFGDPKVTSFLGVFKPKEHPRQLYERMTKKRKKHYTLINSSYNPFSGALVLPTYGLIIEGEVSN